jgi:hypothetical protein
MWNNPCCQMKTVLFSRRLVARAAYAALLWSAFAVNQSANAVPPQTTGNGPFQVKFLANERLDVANEQQGVILAQPNQIPINLHGFAAHFARGMWTGYDNGGGRIPSHSDDIDLPISIRPDGSAFATVTPLEMGKLRLTIVVAFEDGGVASKFTDLYVAPPDSPPEKIIAVADGGTRYHSGHAYLDLSHLGVMKGGLAVRAFYPGVEQSVPIDSKMVNYTILSGNENSAPFAIDASTGTITPVHAGHALVQTSFKGLSRFTCVVVMDHSQSAFDHSNCDEQMPPGLPKLPEIDEGSPPLQPAGPRR